MTELNSHPPVRISRVVNGYKFQLDLDTTGFQSYQRQGIVESVKVPKKVSFHSLKQSLHNPAASTKYGSLEPVDYKLFGRSEQLHLALRGIWDFQAKHKRLPSGDDDAALVLEAVKTINEEAKASEGMYLDQIED